MIDWTKPIELNDGTPCKVVHVFNCGNRIVAPCDGSYDWSTCTNEGFISLNKFVRNTPPPKRRGTVWVNVYDGFLPSVHESRAVADTNAHSSRLACVGVPWEEGQGL